MSSTLRNKLLQSFKDHDVTFLCELYWLRLKTCVCWQ